MGSFFEKFILVSFELVLMSPVNLRLWHFPGLTNFFAYCSDQILLFLSDFINLKYNATYLFRR